MIRRTNYFIKKGFQASFAAKFALLIVLEAVLIAGLFVYISDNTLTTGYNDSILTIERTSNFFLLPLAVIIVIAAVGIGIAGMIVFILLSHRIAGPLYRFEKDINQMEYGDLTKRISLRKTDQLTEVKEAVNSLVATFDQRVGKVKDILAELKSLTDRGESVNSSGVQGAVKKLKEELDKFKVSSGPNG
jgi:methyl-accepting chemotaxis protein